MLISFSTLVSSNEELFNLLISNIFGSQCNYSTKAFNRICDAYPFLEVINLKNHFFTKDGIAKAVDGWRSQFNPVKL
jgi:hypothetical protein